MSGIPYPITVTKVLAGPDEVYKPNGLFGAKCGAFVAVRPCDDEFNGKTFLGVCLGEVALSGHVSWDKASGELTVHKSMHNPMIYIPELKKVVWGCGSWWGELKDETTLRKITDADINNTWYVQALKQLSEKTNVQEGTAGGGGEEEGGDAAGAPDDPSV